MTAAPLTYEELAFPIFRNSRVVGTVGGTDITVEDALRAALVTRCNILAVGGRGTGKTQAMSDIGLHFFGGEGEKGKFLFIECTPDFKEDQLFTHGNLSKLHTAQSTDDIIEVSKRIDTCFFGADEFSRAPEISQNRFMSLANGYYAHKNGQRYPLGNGEYSVAMATANVGNGEYSGTFRMDAAGLDRWQLILDLNYWRKTADDENGLRKQKRDPRVKRAPIRDISEKLIEAYKSIGNPSESMDLISLYLTQGLDYCEKFPQAENSKRVLADKFPVICHEKTCGLRSTACGIAKPLEERTAQTIVRLAQGFEYIAKLKNPATGSDPVGSMLTAYALIASHNRVLSQQYVMQDENFNNPALAGKNAAEKLRAELELFDKADSPVFRAYKSAKEGEKSGIEALEQKFEYLKPFLRDVAAQLRGSS